MTWEELGSYLRPTLELRLQSRMANDPFHAAKIQQPEVPTYTYCQLCTDKYKVIGHGLGRICASCAIVLLSFSFYRNGKMVLFHHYFI